MKIEKVFTEDIIETMEEQDEACDSHSKIFRKMRDKETNPETKYLYGEVVLANDRLSMLFDVQVALMKTINVYADLMAKVPDEKELNGLRQELEQVRTEAISILAPIRDRLNEIKASEKKAAEMNGYG